MNLIALVKQHPQYHALLEKNALLREKWAALSERDRYALIFLTGFLSLWLIISLTLSAHHWLTTEQTRYEQAASLLKLMHEKKPLAQRAATLAQNNNGAGAQSLLPLINSTAQAHEVALKRIEPDGEHAVRMWLEGVRYDKLATWLLHLNQQQHIRVKDLSLNRHAQAGLVNGSIILSR